MRYLQALQRHQVKTKKRICFEVSTALNGAFARWVQIHASFTSNAVGMDFVSKHQAYGTLQSETYNNEAIKDRRYSLLGCTTT